MAQQQEDSSPHDEQLRDPPPYTNGNGGSPRIIKVEHHIFESTLAYANDGIANPLCTYGMTKYTDLKLKTPSKVQEILCSVEQGLNDKLKPYIETACDVTPKIVKVVDSKVDGTIAVTVTVSEKVATNVSEIVTRVLPYVPEPVKIALETTVKRVSKLSEKTAAIVDSRLSTFSNKYKESLAQVEAVMSKVRTEANTLGDKAVGEVNKALRICRSASIGSLRASTQNLVHAWEYAMTFSAVKETANIATPQVMILKEKAEEYLLQVQETKQYGHYIEPRIDHIKASAVFNSVKDFYDEVINENGTEHALTSEDESHAALASEDESHAALASEDESDVALPNGYDSHVALSSGDESPTLDTVREMEPLE